MIAKPTMGLLAAVCLAAVTSTFAQDVKGKPAQKPEKAEMAMPKPAPEMAQLRFFDGNWTCAGTISASPFGPAGKMTSTVRTHSDLGGFWESGVVKATSPSMPPFEGMFHMTWDPAAKHHLMFWVDSMGGWAQSTAPGWEGDKIVFTGDSYMGGQKFGTRDTFGKGAAGTLKHNWEMQQDGKWTPLGDETCHKAAAAAAKK
jgi:Protein of unknown function (DUF1579)